VKPAERFRLTFPLLLLLASIGIMLVAAFQAQSAVRRHELQAEEAIHDYATFASWSVRQHVKDALFAAAAEVLQPFNHGNALHLSPTIPPVVDLAHLMRWDSAGCYCHVATYPPIRFLAFTLGADTLAVAPNIHPWPDRGAVVDTVVVLQRSERSEIPHVEPYRADESAWILRRLTESVRYEFRYDQQYHFVIEQRSGRPYVFAYRPMPTARGDTIVYAIEFSARTMSRLFGMIIDQQSLLPPTLTRDLRNREILALEVSDEMNRVVYRSEPDLRRSAFVSEDRVPDAMGGFAIRVAVKPDVAGTLVIGGLPRSRLPMLLGLLGLATALAFVAFQQLRRAAALTRTRASFVAAVSHELRTPLSQIRLYLDTLRLNRVSSDRDRVRSLENLDREATRLGNLVENVLRFASIGQSKAARPDVCDVDAEIRNTAAAFEPLARSGRATVQLELQPGVTAPLSRDAFRVALHNLLDNAVKYGPPGQTVTVRMRRAGEYVRIEVEDQGMGVAVADRDSVWEPFERGSDEAARTVGGSGIGLSIVRDIVQRHGGRARVESADCGGARFVLEFPGAAVATQREAMV
jgi:signal transduction histidine kinase